jgi:hypothetical protein
MVACCCGIQREGALESYSKAEVEAARAYFAEADPVRLYLAPNITISGHFMCGYRLRLSS